MTRRYCGKEERAGGEHTPSAHTENERNVSWLFHYSASQLTFFDVAAAAAAAAIIVTF